MIEPDGLRLGAAALIGSDVYIGDDNEPTLLPSFLYRRGRWSASVRGLFYRVLDLERGSLAAGLALRRSELDAADSAELDGIERTSTFDLSLETTHRTGPLFWRGSAAVELGDEHGGGELTLQGGVPIPIPGAFVQGFLGGTWQSEALAGYLYGVRPEERTATRAAYEPGSIVTPFAGVLVRRPLPRDWGLLLSTRVTWLPNEVTRSPIVEEPRRLTTLLAIDRRF